MWYEWRDTASQLFLDGALEGIGNHEFDLDRMITWLEEEIVCVVCRLVSVCVSLSRLVSVCVCV